MKLTVFNQETMPKGLAGIRSGGPRITFGTKGAININEAAAELMDFKAENCISFAQDEEDPANWYVFLDKDGYELRQLSDKKSLGFSHNQMCRAIKESLGLDTDKPARFLIAGQPNVHNKVKYWGLIIKQF